MKPSALVKLVAVLWGIWGAFHLAVGVYLLLLLSRGQTAEALNGIAGGSIPAGSTDVTGC